MTETQIKRVKSDVLAKRVLRAFRDFCKKMFMDTHGSKYYYWVLATVRRETKDFFTNGPFNFDEATYNQYEFLFIRLIHNSKKGEDTSNLNGIQDNHRNLLKEVFGSKPTTENLRDFFRIDVIQQLWWGPSGFITSSSYQKILVDAENPEKAFTA